MGETSVAVIVPVGGRSDSFPEQLGRVIEQCDAGSRIVLSVNNDDPVFRSWFEATLASFDDERLSTVDSSDVRGAAHARNVGVAASTAQSLVFCDSDDLVNDGWLSALIAGLADYDAVSGHVVDVYADARPVITSRSITPGRLPEFLGRPYVLSGNLAIKREAFEAVGGFDTSLHRCEDIALGWALQLAGYSIGYVEGAQIQYQHRAGLIPMLTQHYHYGRGMSQVIRRHPPARDASGSRAASIRSLLRPNSRLLADTSLHGMARRGATAAGRARGLIG